MWNKPGKCMNPLYTPIITKYPEKSPNIDLNEKYVNYSRGFNGETLLHMAIIEGNIKNLLDLINNKKAYVESSDYKLASPLYYACTHDGTNSILDNNISLRKQIITILLDAGANPFMQSGYSGMRCHEATEFYKMPELTKIIVNHKYFKIWKEARDNYNISTPKKEIEYISKKAVDLLWRRRTVHWLFALARENMANVKPHPNILENQKIYMKKFNGNISDTIEELFRDCVDRHNNLLEYFE